MKKEIKTLEDLLSILETQAQTQVTIDTINTPNISDITEIYLPQYDAYIYNYNDNRWFVDYDYRKYNRTLCSYDFYNASYCYRLYKLLTQKLELNVAIDESNYDRKLYLIDDEEKTFICDDCNIRYIYDEYNVLYNTEGNQICRNCLDDNYRYCDNCGCIMRCDDANWDDYDGCYCNDCIDSCGHWDSDENYDDEYSSHESDYDNHREIDCDVHNIPNILDYHRRPAFIFHGTNTYGIELEVDTKSSVSHINSWDSAGHILDILGREHIYCNYDGSLYGGYEIITHPHSIEELFKLDWETAFSQIIDDGFRSHDAGSCGLHIHIDRENFGADEEEQNENIAKLFVFFNKWWSDIVKFSRRKTSQLTWCNKNYMDEPIDLDANTHNFSEKLNVIKAYVEKKDGSHGVAINNSNEHTVEIRVPRGTLNYKTFRATILFIEHLVKRTNLLNNQDLLYLDNWLTDLPDEVKDYLASRNCFNFEQNTSEEE